MLWDMFGGVPRETLAPQGGSGGLPKYLLLHLWLPWLGGTWAPTLHARVTPRAGCSGLLVPTPGSKGRRGLRSGDCPPSSQKGWSMAEAGRAGPGSVGPASMG